MNKIKLEQEDPRRINMKKELCQREENGVLFTPDLFDVSDIRWGRQRYHRIIFALTFAVALTIVAVLIIAAVWGNGNGMGTGQGGNSGYENGQNGVVIPESDTESESFHETGTDGKGNAEETESTAKNESEPVTETESEEEETFSVIVKDLSEANRGAGFVINFTDEKIDISSLLDRGFVEGEAVGSQAPVVMIIHTHTTEEYERGSNYFKGPVSVVSVGDAITDELNRAGLSTIHCTVIHDSGNRNAYLEARDTISTMLKIYPSIKYVIDVHRMIISEGGVPIKTLSPSGAAQVRLSVSTEKREGGDFRESSLALSLRQEMNRDDGICMPILIMGGGYNADLSVYHLVAEVGTDKNSVEEAILSGRAFARAIAAIVLE